MLSTPLTADKASHHGGSTAAGANNASANNEQPHTPYQHVLKSSNPAITTTITNTTTSPKMTMMDLNNRNTTAA